MIGCRDAEDLARTAMLLAEQPLPRGRRLGDRLQRRRHGRPRRRRGCRRGPGRPGVLARPSRGGSRRWCTGPRAPPTRSMPAPVSSPEQLAELLGAVLDVRRGGRGPGGPGRHRCDRRQRDHVGADPGAGRPSRSSRCSPSRWAGCRRRRRAIRTRSRRTGPQPPRCGLWAARWATPSGGPSNAASRPGPSRTWRSGCGPEPGAAGRRPGAVAGAGTGCRAADAVRHRRPGQFRGLGRRRGVAPRGRCGFPVAIKVTDPDVVHKTELGLVRAGLRTQDEVRAAYRHFRDVLGHAAGGAGAAHGVRHRARRSGWCATRPSAPWSWWRPAASPPTSGTTAPSCCRRLGRRRRAGPVSLRIAPLLSGFRGAPAADLDGGRGALGGAGPARHRRSRGRRARPQPGHGRSVAAAPSSTSRCGLPTPIGPDAAAPRQLRPVR